MGIVAGRANYPIATEKDNFAVEKRRFFSTDSPGVHEAGRMGVFVVAPLAEHGGITVEGHRCKHILAGHRPGCMAETAPLSSAPVRLCMGIARLVERRVVTPVAEEIVFLVRAAPQEPDGLPGFLTAGEVTGETGEAVVKRRPSFGGGNA
jgi:hypothetical protein